MGPRRGSLRVYLGASPGVGKTFAMLNEGRRRAERGTDVVVAVVETHGRAQTASQLQGMEVLPRRAIEYRGTTLLEMDLDAVLARHPDVALVDEYAHTNIPGSKHEKRWQDVEAILDAGIDVITTVNVQHLESLNDVVNQITATAQRETIPDVVVRRADQIELIDMSPEAIRRRMAHGNIYASEKIDAALGNYFRPGNLGALRELALLWLADRVDEALHGYRETQGISDRWETRERVVVGLTGVADGESVIRRASRMAGRLGGELVGVHVAVNDGLERQTGPALEEQRQLVRELGGEVFEVVGDDPVQALVEFARQANATQLVLGASRRSRWHELIHGSFVARLARQATTFDVHVIGGGTPASGTTSRVRKREVDTLQRARALLAIVIAVIAIPLLTIVLSNARANIELSTVLLVYLVVVLIVAGIGGRVVAVVTAVVASLIVNWYFVDPIHTFTITEGQNVVALVVFVIVAAAVGWLVDIVSRRAREANRLRLQAQALARSAANLAGEADPLPAMLTQTRATFDLDGLRLRSADNEDDVEAGDVTGEPTLRLPITGPGSEPTGELLVYGRSPSADEQRILRVVASQLSVALNTRRLAERAADASTLAQVDEVRTAMLRSVSHDLRSPLASIKALVSGLLEPDVEWDRQQINDQLTIVEAEADRLNRLVGNLLDASRLQSGELATNVRPTPLVETVEAAVGEVDCTSIDLDVNIPADLPLVDADPVLLERALDNILANARRFNPPGAPPIRIDAAALGDSVHLRIVDHGPGIARERRRQVVEPFQRLGDERSGDGVGLGLTIAQGFVTAMGGRLGLDDTPGGGLTVTIVLHPSIPTEDQPCPPS